MYHTCPRCNGWCWDRDENDQWIKCPLCSGRGYLTEREHTAVTLIYQQVMDFENRVNVKFDKYLRRAGLL